MASADSQPPVRESPTHRAASVDTHRQASQPGTSSAAGPSTDAALTSSAQTPAFGPAVWQLQRKQWTEATQLGRQPKREAVISPSATYDDLLLSHDPFAEPVPLPEMIEFLIDAWIQDGLYD